MSNVWKHSQADHGALLVLLAIADFADANGEAFPSIATLASKSRLSERKVQLALKELETLGELSIEQGTGPHGRYTFRVLVGIETNVRVKNIHPEENAPRRKCGVQKSATGVQNFRDRGAVSSPPPTTPYKVEPSIEPSEEPSGRARERATADPVESADADANSKSENKTAPPSRSNSGTGKKPGDQTPRGCRLPADWSPTDADREVIAAECPDLDIDKATVEFRDYWRAVAGAKGVKADWSATWRNGMRKSFDMGRFLKTAASVPPRASPRSSNHLSAEEQRVADLRALLQQSRQPCQPNNTAENQELRP